MSKPQPLRDPQECKERAARVQKIEAELTELYEYEQEAFKSGKIIGPFVAMKFCEARASLRTVLQMFDRLIQSQENKPG